jgi:DNA-binding MurR/RpiR family transcriptional regulator
VREPAEASGLPDDVTVRIRRVLPELPAALRRIADHVLARPTEVAGWTIGECADHSRTSLASVTRFCRAVGFGSYPELRLALATEHARQAAAGWVADVGTDIQPDDPMSRVLSVIRLADTRGIDETAQQLDLALAEQVIDAVAAARRIDLFGVGGSGLVAAELAGRLHRIGRPAWARSELPAALSSAALLRPGDVAIAISHSGRSRESVEMLRQARASGATAIALTNHPRSPLAEVATLVLTTAVRPTTFRPGGLAALHSQLFVADCIYLGVAQRNHQEACQAFAATSDAVAAHKIGGPSPS